MIDTHDWLVKAWDGVNHPAILYKRPAGTPTPFEQLTAAPLSQDELLHLADTDWKDPVKRTALVNRWQNDAIARYKRVLAETSGK